MAEQLDVDQDIFKDAFKRYKRRQPPPDMRNVIDFRALLLDQSRNEVRECIRVALDNQLIQGGGGRYQLLKIYTFVQ